MKTAISVALNFPSMTDTSHTLVQTGHSKTRRIADLYVYDMEDGMRMNLTESIDAPVGDTAVADHQQGAGAPSVVWTKDNYLYFQLSTMGDIQLYFASLEGEAIPGNT